MEIKRNAVGWFEIPVSDMNRAKIFYETVFNIELTISKLGENFEMALFPFAEVPGSSGSLVFNKEFYKPSTDGILIYFTSSSGDLSNELSKIESAGGKIISPKKQISEEYGYMALFIDTEGNRIALHSRN